MKSALYFIILSICFLSVIVFAIVGTIPTWCYFISSGVGLVTMILLLRSVILPSKVVASGMDLIGAQDYNNRLVKVGEPNADRIVTLFNSIIDKLRAERLINREQEGFLKLLIDATPMGVLILDFDRRVTLINPAFVKMFDIAPDNDLLGKDFDTLSASIILEMQKVKLGNSGIIRLGDFRIYRCYHLNFLQEGFKREFYLLESLTDEIMRAERAAYETIVRTISHEVNNTMGGIKVVLEMMGDLSEDKEMTRVIESCNIRCDKMCSFVSDYADVVKLPKPDLKGLDLVEEVNQLLPFLHQMLPPGVELNFYPHVASATLMADSVQLQQVIVNIVKNASESICAEGYVNIDINNGDGGVNIEISNNGVPIDEDAARQLFTPFFTTKPNGKGLGLTLAREVLTNHNATYRLFTDGSGVTRFSITFPSKINI